MSKEKREGKETSSKSKEIVPVRPKHRPEPTLAPYRRFDPRYELDRALERFRRDFQDLLWPYERFSAMEFPGIRELEAGMPSVDLEDRGKEFVLTAEIPGFRKDEIEIQVQDNGVEITGQRSSRRDEKLKGYVQKERSFESFYRMIRLPEDVKTKAAEANLRDGVLELTLPKRTPKPRKRVSIK